MKRIILLVVCLLTIGSLPINVSAQNNPPVRSQEQLETIERLIEEATKYGTTRVQVGVHYENEKELLEQLEPFDVKFEHRFGGVITPVNYLVLRVNVAAIIFLRDSELAITIGGDGLLQIQIVRPPDRSPEELAFFQQLIEQAQNFGIVRTTVGLNIKFTPEGNLTPEQRRAQREAISLIQDELLRQLVPYQANLVTKYDSVPFITLDVDAAALTFMRDSQLVSSVRGNTRGFPIRREILRKKILRNPRFRIVQ